MGAFRYAYANARIHGMRSRLLSKKQLSMAVKLPSIGEFLVFLENSPYKEILYAKEVRSTKEIEKTLFNDLMKMNKKVLNFAPGTTKEFLAEYLRRYEIQYIKNLLYHKAGNKENFQEAFAGVLSKKIHELSAKFKEAKTVEEVIFALENTQYKFLRNYVDEYKNSNSIFPLALSLDKHYFHQLRDKVKKLSSKDREIAEKFFGIEIDVINIMTLLRKINNENLEQFLILPFHRIPQKVITNCLSSNSVEDVIAKLSETVYGKVLSDALSEYQKTGSLLSFELALKKYVLDKNKEFSLGDPFHIGTILSYLTLRENEIKNLGAIAVGIENNMQDEISHMIVS